MKKNLYLLIALFTASSAFAEQATSTLHVKGMFSSDCATKVESALKQTAGVKSASVDYGQGAATVTYDNSKLNPEDLAETITDLGYESTVAR